jgi:hypothetical protein
LLLDRTKVLGFLLSFNFTLSVASFHCDLRAVIIVFNDWGFKLFLFLSLGLLDI